MAASRVVDRKRVRKEMHNLFQSYKKKKAVRSKPAWRHKFYCLVYHDQEKISLTEVEKEELYLAGLGEQEIIFRQLHSKQMSFKSICTSPFHVFMMVVGTSF